MSGVRRRAWIYGGGLAAVAGSLAVVVLLLTPSALVSGLTPATDTSAASSSVKHCAVGANPAFPAYDPVNRYIYVPDTGGASITIVKSTCTVVASIALPSGAKPFSAAFDPQDNFVYVTDFNLSLVYVISGTTWVATINGGWFDFPIGIVYDPAAAGMLVTNFDSENVTEILGTSAFAFYSPGGAPYGIAIDPVFDTIDVAFPFSDEFSLAYPNQPIYVLPSTIYYVGTGDEPLELAYDPAIPAMFVTNDESSNVSVFISVNAAEYSVHVGKAPIGVCYSTDRQDMYVMNEGSNSVSEIDGGLTVAKTVKLGSGVAPYGCAYDDATGNMYVTGWTSGQLYVLS